LSLSTDLQGRVRPAWLFLGCPQFFGPIESGIRGRRQLSVSGRCPIAEAVAFGFVRIRWANRMLALSVVNVSSEVLQCTAVALRAGHRYAHHDKTN